MTFQAGDRVKYIGPNLIMAEWSDGTVAGKFGLKIKVRFDWYDYSMYDPPNKGEEDFHSIAPHYLELIETVQEPNMNRIGLQS